MCPDASPHTHESSLHTVYMQYVDTFCGLVLHNHFHNVASILAKPLAEQMSKDKHFETLCDL